MILCDMDGPLVDIMSAMLRVHGREDLLANYPKGEWLRGHHLGLTDEQLVAGVEAEGVGFWTGLTEQPWAAELLALLESHDEVEICTDPNFGDWSASGKRIWLRQHFGGRYLATAHLTGRKWRLAGPGAILLDDSNANVKAFIDAGGDAIVWPMPWNTGWLGCATGEEKLAHVEAEIERIRERRRRIFTRRDMRRV